MTIISIHHKGHYESTVVSSEADKHWLELDNNGYNRGENDISAPSVVSYLYRNYTFFNALSSN